MTEQDTKKILESINTLANQIDMLAGNIAGLAACVVHLPQTCGLRDKDLNAALTTAAQLAPRGGTSRGGNSPSHHAQDMVRRVASQAQALAALRSAGQ